MTMNIEPYINVSKFNDTTISITVDFKADFLTLSMIRSRSKVHIQAKLRIDMC
jgi:hypothetical protein